MAQMLAVTSPVQQEHYTPCCVQYWRLPLHCSHPFVALLQSAPARPSKAPDAGVASSGSSSSTPAPAAGADKPAHDVVAGAMARAASQSTIHPLDTMKVRMQAGE